MSLNTLVLASTSPYRKTLLERLGLAFETASPQIDETTREHESPRELVSRLAQAKAQAVTQHYPHALVIGSDQVAVLNHHILGKPGTHPRAVAQLREASGRTVEFLTGLCLINTATGTRHVDVVPYSVTFRQLNDTEIDNYLHKEHPYDCAGAFKSEGLGVALFARQQGDDPTALIGLPLIKLVSMLKAEGVNVI